MKLKSFAQIQTGYSFRRKVESCLDAEVGVIQMKDLRGDFISTEDLAYVEMEGLKDHHLMRQGDIVFRSRGEKSTAAILREEVELAIVAAPLLRIRVRGEVALPDYLLWYLNHHEAQAYFHSRSKGTFQRMISAQALKDLEIPIPPLKIQEKIVEVAELAGREKELYDQITKNRERLISHQLLSLLNKPIH